MSWVPQRIARGTVRYDHWVTAEYITQADGDVTAYEVVERDVIDLWHRFTPKEIAFDRWNSTDLVNNPRAYSDARCQVHQVLVLSAADIRALLLLEMSRIRKTSTSPRLRAVRSPHTSRDQHPFGLALHSTRSRRNIFGEQ